MALKIKLKPGEKMILGGAAVTNANSASCDLIIENNVPILRQKDIMTEKEAVSPCSQIYLVIQLMYIDRENLLSYINSYWKLVQNVVQAAPSTVGLIDQISERVLNKQHYQALKLAKQLIGYEKEAISRVTECV